MLVMCVAATASGCLDSGETHVESTDVAEPSQTATTQPSTEAPAPTTSSTSAPPQPTTTVESSAAGSVAGTVLSLDEMLPVPNATVQLITNSGQGALAAVAGVDASGKFLFQGVRAGTYELYALADGFQPSGKKVDVADGEKVDGIELLLATAPSEGPYTLTQTKTGLLGCGVATLPFPPCRIFTALTEIGGPDLSDLDASELRFHFTGIPVDQWSAAVLEMAWEPTTASANEMSMSWGTPGCHACPVGEASGPSVLQVVNSGEAMLGAFGEAPEEDFGADHVSFFSEMNVAGDTPGVVVQQTYDQYVTLFFGSEAPAGYTATA
jgi:hypothetical protein